MRRFLVTALCVSLAALPFAATAQRPAAPSPDDALIAALKESIRGREHLPATEVFRNVRILTDVSAGALLRIMQNGFSPALNVRCMHCHVPEDFAADEIRAKETAREMLLMVRAINDRLSTMRHLDDDMAVVNCSTCHRGELRPGGFRDRARR